MIEENRMFMNFDKEQMSQDELSPEMTRNNRINRKLLCFVTNSLLNFSKPNNNSIFWNARNHMDQGLCKIPPVNHNL